MDELFDLAPCGFVSLKSEGTIASVNATLCQLLGYTRDELIGRNFEEVLSDKGRESYRIDFRPNLQTSGRAAEVYFWLRARAGDEVAVVANGVRRERDGASEFDCVLLPISGGERRKTERLESELAQARHAVQQANQAKEDFLSIVSHELRTPLNAIMGWAQLVREGVDAETLDLAMDVIDRSGRAQLQIIEDILDVARLRQGKMEVELEPLNFVSLIEQTVASVALAARNQELDLALEVSTANALVCGDCVRLRQVALSLLSNALKFTPRGGSVTVRVAHEGTRLRCDVRDSGRGIAPELLPRVFERFTQGDASTTRTVGGLGLGLALAQSLVELHGGRIEAASPGPGRGATFTLWLPLWSEASDA